VATFAEQVDRLKSIVRGGLTLGDGDVKHVQAHGGMVTTKQVIEGIIDLLGQRSPGGDCPCPCWGAGIEEKPDDTPYQIVEADLNKLLVFPGGLLDPVGGLMEVLLPDATDLDPCTKIGISTPRSEVRTDFDPAAWAVVANPPLDAWPHGWPTPLNFRITSRVSPFLGIFPDPIAPIYPSLRFGGGDNFAGWVLAEVVVAEIEGTKGWWLKNLDTEVLEDVIPVP